MSFYKGQPQTNTGRTWWKSGHTPWNRGVTGEYYLLKAKTGKTINCVVCGKEKYFQVNQLLKRPCRFCSVVCARYADRKSDLAYSSLHARIKKDWGIAKICEKCGSNKTVDWANKTGKYLLDELDWIKLCRKCHIRYDKENIPGAYLNYAN